MKQQSFDMKSLCDDIKKKLSWSIKDFLSKIPPNSDLLLAPVEGFEGRTALCLAAENGMEDICGLIIEKNPRTIDYVSNHTLSMGKTVYHYAARGGRIEVCNLLRDLPSDVVERPNSGSVDASGKVILPHKTLFEKPDFNSVDAEGKTPLHYAIENDHKEVCNFLLPLLVINNNGQALELFQFAYEKKRYNEVCNFLFPKAVESANISSEQAVSLFQFAGGDKEHKSICESLFPKIPLELLVNIKGTSALQIAYENKMPDVCMRILAKNFPLTTTEKVELSFSIIKLISEIDKVQHELIPELISVTQKAEALQSQAQQMQQKIIQIEKERAEIKPTPVKTLIVKEEGDDISLLMDAIRLNDLQKAKELLDLIPGDLLSQERDSTTVLCMAAIKGHASIAKLIIEKNMDTIYYVNNNKRQCAQGVHHYAAKGGSLELCKLLIQYNPLAIEAVDEYGRTMLHFAALCNHKDLCEWLVRERPAIVNTFDKIGYTTFHGAAQAGNEDLCEFLIFTISLESINNVDNQEGKSALQLAHEQDMLRVCFTILARNFPETAERIELLISYIDLKTKLTEDQSKIEVGGRQVVKLQQQIEKMQQKIMQIEKEKVETENILEQRTLDEFIERMNQVEENVAISGEGGDIN